MCIFITEIKSTCIIKFSHEISFACFLITGEEHFLKECSFESATVKSVYPSLKAPIFQLLHQPLFLLVKTSDRGANAVFLPQGLSTPETHPPVNPSIDTMLRSYEERHSLVFSLAHFPFKHFKELSLADFLTNGRSLKPGVPLTDIPVMAFYTKHELDELKPFFKFFYMGDLEVTSNSVSSNRKSSIEMTPAPVGVPMQAGYTSGEGYKSMEPQGYPYSNRLPVNHPQKHAFFLAPVPVIVPKAADASASGNHNILNRSPGEKTASDLPVYSYKGVPLYIPRGRQSLSSSPAPEMGNSEGNSHAQVKSLDVNSLPAGISSSEFPLEGFSTTPSASAGPQPNSLPSGLGDSSPEHLSLVFPSTSRPQPYSLPAGYGGINERQ